MTEVTLPTRSPIGDSEFLALADERPGPLDDWSILMAWRGSVAHGTWVPPTDPDAFDDLDLMGIAVPPPPYYYGLKQLGSRGTVEVQEGIWDCVVYESRKALSLLAKGNPNVLCLLWLPEDLYLWRRPAGEVLTARRSLFSTKAAFPAFRGYAQGQLHNMESGVYQGYMGQKRRELFDRFGYDVKQASHLIRILRQGIEFLTTGEMVVYRPDAAELLEIKRGEWSKERVLREARELDEHLGDAGEASTLPERPDMEAVNALAVELVDVHRHTRSTSMLGRKI